MLGTGTEGHGPGLVDIGSCHEIDVVMMSLIRGTVTISDSAGPDDGNA